MPVNLSVKNVPDALAQRLRERAAALFPVGTRSSIGHIRELRDGR
jgi:plasmid stability protein